MKKLTMILAVLVLLTAVGCGAAPQPSAEAITRQEAEAIALTDAGLTAEEVQGLRTSYEVDDGLPEYEVEFYHDRWEYEYTIHAETGTILSFDKDR